MKQVPYERPTNNGGHHKQFSGPGNLGPRICAPLLNTIAELIAVEREGSEQYLNHL